MLDQIESIKNELKILKVNPHFNENMSLVENIKNLNKQLDAIKIKKIILDNNKNKIKDHKVGNFTLRYQILTDLPSKELRSIVDQGKKDIISGVLVVFCTFENKIGIAVGVTDSLTTKFDATELVKEIVVILGGKGGGGRKDFAQGGGIYIDKIEEAFINIAKKIK